MIKKIQARHSWGKKSRHRLNDLTLLLFFIIKNIKFSSSVNLTRLSPTLLNKVAHFHLKYIHHITATYIQYISPTQRLSVHLVCDHTIRTPRCVKIMTMKFLFLHAL